MRNSFCTLQRSKNATLIQILANGVNEEFGSQFLFGAGTYFAENACKNDQYANVDESMASSGDELHELHSTYLYHKMGHPGKVYYMIICRVVLGFPLDTKDGSTPSNSHKSIFSSGIWWSAPTDFQSVRAR